MIKEFQYRVSMKDEIADYLKKVVSDEGVRWWRDNRISITQDGGVVHKLWIEFTEEEIANGSAENMIMILSLKASS